MVFFFFKVENFTGGFIGFMQSFPPIFSPLKKLRGFAFVDEFKNDCVPRNKHLPIYRWVMLGLSVRFGEQKFIYVHFGMKELGD